MMNDKEDRNAEAAYKQSRGICEKCQSGDCLDCTSTPEDFCPCKCECVYGRGHSLPPHEDGSSSADGPSSKYQVYFQGFPIMRLSPNAVPGFALECRCFVDDKSKTIVLL